MGCAVSSPKPSGDDPYPKQKPPPTEEQQPQQRVMQQPREKEEKTDIKMKKVKLDKEILERYIELEKKIRQLESKNVLKNYKMKQSQLNDFNETIKVYEARYKECVKQTSKEKADVDQLIRDMFKNEEEFTAQQTKEQEEYLEALNKQEIAKKELEQAKRMRDQVKSDLITLKKEADTLQKLYTEQDELLASIFNGKYGSDLEYKLESDLDMLLDHKQRISVAKYKWTNSRVLISHAVNQLKYAVRKWTEMINLRTNNMQTLCSIATETRNNLVAASQNITNAQKYLKTIQFPYCKPEEMDTLNRATNNIYTDMQTPERQAHALNCYTVTYKRAAALLQWFDHVIHNTIEKDLANAVKNVDEKTKELRRERLRLIKAKINEATGMNEDLDIAGELDLGEDGPEPELENLITNPDATSTSDDAGDSTADTDGPTPLPASQLAPVPNGEELFGDIDELKKEHEKQLKEFERAQEVNKARMNQGLEEKLRARRSRRTRQEIQ